MKKWMIIVILLMIGVVMGQSIDFIYPENVEVDEEFEVEVKLVDFSDDIYDVKFEIKDGGNNLGERFWEDDWRSTNFWMENAINLSEDDDEKFDLRIVDDYKGKINMTVKIRDSGDSVEDFVYEINISNPSIIVLNNEIYYEFEYDEDDIVNGKDFKIEVHAYNLDDERYDVRLWIEDNDNILSERFDKENDEWKSGIYYINEVFEGPGNVSEKIKIRIDDDEKDFLGDAFLIFKFRDEDEIEDNVEVLEKKAVEEVEKKVEEKVEDKVDESVDITADVIKLGESNVEKVEEVVETEDINSDKIVYESKAVKIHDYSVYGFTLLCVVFCVLIIWGKLE